MELSIILPTYNERENIQILIPLIIKTFNKVCTNYEILVVDDNSPDGTGEEVLNFNNQYKNVFLISRKNKEGIGAALREGYNKARGKYILSSDTDLSFSVEDMVKLYDKINGGYDLVVGSRYAKGGYYQKKNFRTYIKGLISYLGNKLFGFLFSIPVSDFSANFRVIKKDTWEAISTSENTNFLLFEMIFMTNLHKFSIIEVPVSFNDRLKGESKLNLFFEAPKALVKILKLVFKYKFKIG